MLCDKCKKNEASVHIRKVQKNGEVQALNLCPSCALMEFLENAKLVGGMIPAELKMPVEGGDHGEHDFIGQLVKVLDSIGGGIEDLESNLSVGDGNAAKVHCSACKQNGTNLLRGHVLECPDCLNSLRSVVHELLPDGNGLFLADMNCGSKLPELNRDVKLRLELEDLQKLLEQAVKAERYEEAAAFKQKIKMTEIMLLEETQAMAKRKKKADSGPLEEEERESVKNKFSRQHPLWCGPKQKKVVLRKGKKARPEILLSSVVGMCRNLQGMPFAGKAGNEKKEIANNDYLVSVLVADPAFNKCHRYSWHDLTFEQKNVLISHGTYSLPEGIGSKIGSVLERTTTGLVGKTNFFDHIACSQWGGPNDLSDSLQVITDLDMRLARKVPYLNDPEYGMVSRNVENLGGNYLCAKYLHLPALMLYSNIDAIGRAVEAMGAKLTPLYSREGETMVKMSPMLGFGAFYCLSFDYAGVMPIDKRIVALNQIGDMLEKQELQKREVLRSDELQNIRCSDIVGKSVGVAANSLLLARNDCYEIISMMWFGVEMGILPDLQDAYGKGIFKELLASLYASNDDDKSDSSMRIAAEFACKNASMIRNCLGISRVNLD